ncbi:hypothetical protein LCGC14_0155860 [marine sediment metagenome]|uniref:Uncharacterized protein n=2 Tax=root TaxID=1 RepID=A0A7V1BM91_9GAMM|nr:hypothetical protein [Halopseudomonas xinjiangensis]
MSDKRLGYVNVIDAIKRATSAAVIDTTSKPSYSPDRINGQAGLSNDDRMALDMMVHAKLHRELDAVLWHALVAKYSACSKSKAKALEQLLPVIVSPADARFTRHAAVAWSFPKPKGRDGKRSTAVLPAYWYDFNYWDTEGRSDTTRRRWNKVIQRWLNDVVNSGLVEVQHILDEEELII